MYTNIGSLWIAKMEKIPRIPSFVRCWYFSLMRWKNVKSMRNGEWSDTGVRYVVGTIYSTTHSLDQLKPIRIPSDLYVTSSTDNIWCGTRMCTSFNRTNKKCNSRRPINGIFATIYCDTFRIADGVMCGRKFNTYLFTSYQRYLVASGMSGLLCTYVIK